jgi:uncharacterized protein with FMN-binding domain
MRRIVLWLASTVTIVVLLFGYHTSTNKTSAAVTSSGSSPATTSSSSEPSTSSSSPSSSPTSSGTTPSGTTSSSTTTKAYTGTVAQTRWGPMQVQITVQGDKITKVTVLQQPNGNNKDAEINSYALPILVQDTLSAQSAQIDMVSGATVTSDGYLTSLQSALDQAGI